MTPQELKQARRALGYSAQGLAGVLGVASGRTIRHWEAGTRPISGPVSKLIRYIQQHGDIDTLNNKPQTNDRRNNQP